MSWEIITKDGNVIANYDTLSRARDYCLIVGGVNVSDLFIRRKDW